MQSFRERCGFHGNQQNYQPTPSQDSSRLENYRHQSPACERQRLVTKEYYSPQQPPPPLPPLPYQGFGENSAVEKYHRGSNKPLRGQQLPSRPASFPNYPIQENSPYPARYAGDESLQGWGSPQQQPPQPLPGGVAKYEDTLMKKTATPSSSRQYHEPTPQLPFRTHSLHLPQQPPPPQPSPLTYPKLPRQKMQNDVPPSLSFSQGSHFPQHSQSFPASSTYTSVQSGSQAAHSYKSCNAPSAPPTHERALGSAANLPSAQRVQGLHSYQPNRIGYDQQQQPPPPPQQQQSSSLQSRHHAQEALHYQNLAKYQHYNQPGQSYCQADAPVRTPDQYYQTFSPSSSHSPARSVGRSPSYSSTPSPLMPNLENFQYSQQSLTTGAFPASLADHSHFMPLLNPSPTDGASSDPQPPANCKNLSKEKIPENLLSDLSLQSLTALTSQVENISNTVQQLLLSKSTGMPQKKGIKNSPRTPEQLKGQHCSPEGNSYSAEQAGTPHSDSLSTPQSVHAETQDADYLSGSEDQLERGFLYCSQSRSPARVNSNSKAKPESVSTCSVTSPDDMSTKSDDSFQSIHTSLPLESFTKFVAGERDCPRLLLSALSQEELASEIIGLQDAISEKADKGWANSPAPNKDPDKSPFHLENHRTCLDSVVKSPWSNQGDANALAEPLKLDKGLGHNNGKNFPEEVYDNSQVPFTATETKNSLKTTSSVGYNAKPNISVATSGSETTGSFSCYSNAAANSVSSENAMENFDWPDENLSDTWKELGSSLQSSDLPKSLFSGRLSETSEEKKKASCLSLCDPAGSSEAEEMEGFSQQQQAPKGEGLNYDEATRRESERWLEDTTRNPCSGEDFSELPMMSSPDLKESDLEPEEYSSLCELAGSEQKTLTYDAFTPKPAENAPALSLQDTPGSAEETTNTVEKENTAPPSHLSDPSVILLGPAVGPDTKVKSWFETSLHHLKSKEETAAGKNGPPDKTETSTTLLLKKQVLPEKLTIISEPTSRGKSLRSKKLQCRLSDGEESIQSMSNLCTGLQAAGLVANTCPASNNLIEMPNKNTHGQTPRFPTEVLPARMCTRSFTAMTEPRMPDPLEGAKASTPHEKLGKKSMCVLKERAAFKARKANGKESPKPPNPSPPLISNLAQNEDSAVPKAKEADAVETEMKDQQSMILRSRTRTQEVFYTKRRREKNVVEVEFKNAKLPKKVFPNNHLPGSFKISPPNQSEKESKLGKRMKLPKARPDMGSKISERPLHTLKRKSVFTPPIPAKKRNLILRSNNHSSNNGKEEKPDVSSGLFKRMPSSRRTAVKPSPKNACEAMLKSPQAKENPGVCIKITSRASFQGAMKTKVLPPRKGRGLKLEAIVQKITSPNLKKFACKTVATAVSAMVPTAAAHSNPLGSSLPEREQASKNTSGTPAVGEARPLNQALSQKAPAAPAAEQLCRNPNNRSFRGKLMNSKKLSSNCFKGEAYSSPETLQHSGGVMAASGIGLLPKKRNRQGKAAAFHVAKNSLEKRPHLSPALFLASREKSVVAAAVAGKGEEGQREGKTPKGEDKGPGNTESAEGRSPQAQTRAQRQRSNHSSYNGYTKRQRKKHRKHRKAPSVPSRCKSKARRRHQQQAPLLSPAEPEIRLKYVSCKRLRADSRAPPFSPYVRMEKWDEFVSTCTVVNFPAEEAKLHNEQQQQQHSSSSFSSSSLVQTGLWGAACLRPPAILPLSSMMHLGPVVSKALNAACLVCCLCRHPANYKDQGDLCGPYYPEDCLPKKKSRLKEKVKVEGPGEEPPSSSLADRLLKATDNNCAAGTPGGKSPRLDSGADSAKQSALRSSSRGMFRKLQSCYCCDERTEGEEATAGATVAAVEKLRRHECGKAESPLPDPAGETQEHWVHEACAVWTAGVYLVAGKLYGLQEAIKMAADVRCSGCQRVGATVGCCHKGCTQIFHYTCAIDTGCSLTEETFLLNCPKHKTQLL
ncbi:retinoic acid-induced protein 1 [Candoia aspera]|uniref:retinoic acid-induced protein 1 n=1 Tax=Candoia aspera TaxID=51853 RepID=UPI002FD7D3AB